MTTHRLSDPFDAVRRDQNERVAAELARRFTAQVGSKMSPAALGFSLEAIREAARRGDYTTAAERSIALGKTVGVNVR